MNELKDIFNDIVNNSDLDISDLNDNEIFNELKNLILLTYLQYGILVNIEKTKENIDELLKSQKNIVSQPIYSQSEIDYLTSKVKYLQTIPQPEQRTKEWYIFRNNRLTASDFYNVIDLKTSCKRNDLIMKKCGVDMPFISSPATRHGIKFESIATSIYEKKNNLEIIEFGCIPHSVISFFGASPDGIVGYHSNNKNYIGRMLEIKCPKSRVITGIIPKGYFAQVQGQLEVCDLEYCDFLECDFQMFKTKDDFFNDTKYTEKGIIIELYNTKLNNYSYYYGEDKYYKDKEIFEKWEESIISNIYSNNDLEYMATTYWYLNKYNVVLVKRDRDYFNKNYGFIKSFWNDVLKYREIGTESLQKKKKKYVYKEPELNFID